MRALINMDRVFEHRGAGALAGSSGSARHGAESRCVLSDARERANSYYEACPQIVQIGDEQVRGAWWAGPITCLITWARQMPSV